MKSLVIFLSLLVSIAGISQEVLNSLELHDIPVREEMKLVVTGCDGFKGPAVAFTTVRGEVWILNDPTAKSLKIEDFHWRRFASGLRRPGKLKVRDDGGILVRQSVDTTLILDRDGDGIADEYLVTDSDKIPKSQFSAPFKGFVWLDKPEPSGPFAGQYFGGSTGGNYLSRLIVTTSETGKHFGLIVFQTGLVYPVDAIARLEDNSWVIAQSNRNEPNRTRTKFAVQRAVWNHETPFEINSIRAVETGFYIEFTKTLLAEPSVSEWSYRIESMAKKEALKITNISLAADQKSVVVECGKVSPGTVYYLSCDGVWSSNREPVRNSSCLFTWEAGF